MSLEQHEDDSKPREGEISVTEAARRLKSSEGYTYSELRVGRLEGRKTSIGRWRVSADGVERRRRLRGRHNPTRYGSSPDAATEATYAENGLGHGQRGTR
jgi:hypothetical protein